MAMLVGAHEVDITPSVGTLLCGSLDPRPAQGIDDPLLIKAIVIESAGSFVAYVILDVAMLGREIGDEAVRMASERTGIPTDSIVWSCTHTHTSPYTNDWFPHGGDDPVNHEWLDALPEKFAECVACANDSRAEARLSRTRAYQCDLGHNRRVRYKDGREINTWLLEKGEDDVQAIGLAGPTDPEIGILAFDNDAGDLLAVMFHYTLHANTNFGPNFSGDYPAVVADRIREYFGPDVCTLFLPGACGDINKGGNLSYEDVGNALADQIIPKLEARVPFEGSVSVSSQKADLVVPCRDLAADEEDRIRKSQWGAQSEEYFRKNQAIMRERGITEANTVIQAWRIGEVGFVSLPGEPFVGLGMELKQKSPFPWTYMVELGGDYVGYLVTQQAWEGGGYESLTSTVAPISVEGVEMMMKAGHEMLGSLMASK